MSVWVQCLGGEEDQSLTQAQGKWRQEVETRVYERDLGYARSDDEEVERVKDKKAENGEESKDENIGNNTQCATRLRVAGSGSGRKGSLRI